MAEQAGLFRSLDGGEGGGEGIVFTFPSVVEESARGRERWKQEKYTIQKSSGMFCKSFKKGKQKQEQQLAKVSHACHVKAV